MLISFEGIDGSGKSTQASMLAKRLEREGHTVLRIREPGGTHLSEKVREILLDPEIRIDPFAEMLLFSAARAQLVTEEIVPALAENRIVVCDRFFDSTIAYQGAGRGVAEGTWLTDFQLHVTRGIQPDRTYLISVPVETALSRRAGRSEDRMEASGDGFHQRVATAYSKLAAANRDRIVEVDGTKSVESIHEDIWRDFTRRLDYGRNLHS